MTNHNFIDEHRNVTRRYFLRLGMSGVAVNGMVGRLVAAEADRDERKIRVKPDKAGALPNPYFTPSADFRDVSRGKPVPHSLSAERMRAVGMTRGTWKLEVIPDPDHPADLGQPLSKADDTALDFESLLKLGEQHAVRFPKVMTCLNLGCPLGMGLWEGVPLREVVWLTQPRADLRRVFYNGFHNDDPKQLFRSSLPIGRVMEDPFDLPPVILCYKLNGEWLDAERGGPVRMVVPEHYGFKSVKWLTHVVLTNLSHANDTYAEKNNDVDSPLKTFSATLSIPAIAKVGEPVPVSGYAQVGISGLSRVQVFIEPTGAPRPENDPFFTQAPWVDAEILAPPTRWNTLAEGRIPSGTHGFDSNGRPVSWPMRLTNAHWAAVLPGLPAGEYTLRSRAIDEKGHAQPMPRPFRKSGRAAIESVAIKVEA